MIEFIKSFGKNFLSKGNSGVEIDLVKGITSICGKNGHGKSTLFEELYFALTGKSYRGAKKGSLINRTNKKNLETKIVFNKNGDEYIIGRRIKPPKDMPTEYILKNGKELDIIDKRNFQSEVEKILGVDEKMLKQTIFLSQDFYVPFIDLDLNDKRKFITKVFGLDKFKNMEVNIKEDVREMKKNKEVYNTEVLGLRDKIEYAEKQINERKESLSLKLKNENENIIVYKKELNELKEKLIDIDVNMLEEKENKLMNIKLKKRSIETDINNLNTTLYDIAHKKSKIEEFENDIIDNKEELKIAIERRKKLTISHNLEVLDKAIEKMKDKRGMLFANISAYKNELDEKEKELEFYKKTDICDVCKSELTEEFKNDHIEKIQNKIDNINDGSKKSKNKLTEIENKITKLTDKRIEIKEIIEQQRKQDNAINDLKKDIQFTEEKIKSIKIEDSDKINDQIENKKIDLKKIENKIIKFENEIKTDRINDSHNKEMNLKINTKENEIKNCQKLISEYNMDMDNINSNNDISKFKDEYEEKNSNLKKLKLKLEYTQRVLSMIGDKGIKKYIVSQYLPLLNKYITDYSKLMNFDHKIMIKDGGMNIEIKDRGKEVDKKLYSSGEKQKINISILFAFLSLMRTKSGIELPLLLLDEITSPLDIENVTLFYKILKQEFKDMCVMVISHRTLETNSEHIDRLIEVKKDIRGFSEYLIDEK